VRRAPLPPGGLTPPVRSTCEHPAGAKRRASPAPNDSRCRAAGGSLVSIAGRQAGRATPLPLRRKRTSNESGIPVQNQVSGKRISTRTDLLTAAFGDCNDTCIASASLAAATVPRGPLDAFPPRHARRRAGVAVSRGGSTRAISRDIIWSVSDVLIRDIPDDVLAGLDARAAELGLSRVEYIRRRLAQDARMTRVAVTRDDIHRLGQAVAGLADEKLMRGAWE